MLLLAAAVILVLLLAGDPSPANIFDRFRGRRGLGKSEADWPNIGLDPRDNGLGVGVGLRLASSAEVGDDRRAPSLSCISAVTACNSMLEPECGKCCLGTCAPAVVWTRAAGNGFGFGWLGS